MVCEDCGEGGTDGVEHVVERGLGGGIDDVILLNRVEVGVKVKKNSTGVHHPKVLEKCSDTLFHKLATLVSETVPTYHDIVAQNTSSQDGYATLYQILRTILPRLQDFRTKWGLTLDKNQDMYRFVRVMQEHATSKAEFD